MEMAKSEEIPHRLPLENRIAMKKAGP